MATAMAIGTLGYAGVLRTERTEEKSWLTGLSGATTAVLAKASTPMVLQPGELVYCEGVNATGAYIVRRGKVKLVASSSDGKALILRIALPGEIIGLSAALSTRSHDTNAEVLEPTSVAYIKTSTLYELMEKSSDLALRLAEQLSIEYSSLCQELSTLGLQRSAISRLAKLLAGLLDGTEPVRGKIQLTCNLTHEEMAQMIGTSRETVTRLLRELRDQGIATLKNNILVIDGVDRLKALID